MIDKDINNPKSIKYYVKKYLLEIKPWLANKIIIDIPAGNGATAEILLESGAKVEAFDLFPEDFMLNNIECKQADIMREVPVEDNFADMLICQEGIEHFSDQMKVFKEFNRVLKPDGKLLITTPSYSNLSARLSYFLFESETSKKMPPNELDDIWKSSKIKKDEIYYGHIFLLGFQKIRVLGKLSGFDIEEIRYTRLSKSSLFLFPLVYPIIYLHSRYTYCRNMKKASPLSRDEKRKVYREQMQVNIRAKNLLNKHIFIIFKKEQG
jgi:ubiquinone/menaquinone biosynthesis C-methylase UbiE